MDSRKVKVSFNATALSFDVRWRQMNHHRSLCIAALLVAAALLAGCHGNPDVRKLRYLESGKRFNAEGKYREAVIQYLNALKVDRDYPDAHYELAQTYEHLGQFAAACSELERTVDLQPGNEKARLDLGSLSLADGNIEETLTQANALLAAQPDNPSVHALLSAIAARRGQEDQALIEIHRALALDPNRAVFHEDLALLLAGDRSRISSVEAELKKAVDLDPKSLSAKLLLSAFYDRNHRLPEAENIGWDAVTMAPDSLAARENVAQIIFKRGDQARAEQVLRQASKDLAGNPQGVRMLAEYYLASGQLDKARAEYANLVARNPKSVPLRKGYIRVLLQVRDYASARTLVAGLMKTDPGDQEVAALNGILLFNQGSTNEGANLLFNSAANFPEDSYIQYWLGKAALSKGEIDLAERSFWQAAEVNPSVLDAQQELAQIAAQRGDLGMLTDVADKTIAAAPDFAGGYVWRATVEMNRNHPEQAEANLKNALTVAPSDWQAYLQLGKLRFAEKRFAEGAVLLEHALQYNPNSVDAMRLLIDYDVYRHEPEKALARLNAQIQKSPKNGCLLDLLAQLQVQNNQIDQAAATAQKATQLNSSDGEAVMLLAQIAIQRGETANAIATWMQWSKTHPEDAGALAVLGTLEESRGNLETAEADYKKSLQIQPLQPIAANNLAYRMLISGEMPEIALTLAQTARLGMPDSPNTADTLAWAYYYNGTYQFARDLLEDAVKTNPRSATMQYHLGMVDAKLRDKSSAANHLKRALALSPDSPVGKDAKAALQGLS
jgi:Flp pilus assembly protein TadD